MTTSETVTGSALYVASIVSIMVALIWVTLLQCDDSAIDWHQGVNIMQWVMMHFAFTAKYYVSLQNAYLALTAVTTIPSVELQLGMQQFS